MKSDLLSLICLAAYRVDGLCAPAGILLRFHRCRRIHTIYLVFTSPRSGAVNLITAMFGWLSCKKSNRFMSFKGSEPMLRPPSRRARRTAGRVRRCAAALPCSRGTRTARARLLPQTVRTPRRLPSLSAWSSPPFLSQMAHSLRRWTVSATSDTQSIASVETKPSIAQCISVTSFHAAIGAFLLTAALPCGRRCSASCRAAASPPLR